MADPIRDSRLARVLVTGAGGPSAVSIIKSLGRIPGVDLWVADIDPHAAGLYLAPADRRVLLPRGDAAGFSECLLDWCRNESISVVFPTVDQELRPLAAARQAFEGAGVTLVLAAAATLAVCLDKWRLYEACRGFLPVPRTALLDQSSTLADWNLPCIVKPRTGSGSRDVRLVRSEADLAQLPRDGSFMIQEYLPGEEHSLDVLADPEGRVLSVVPRLRLKVDSGVAVAGRTLHDQELESLGRTVAARIGLSWVGNVQTRRDAAGVARLLEVNPRFPGTMPLTVAAGVDMPAICLAMAQGHTASVPVGFREVAMVRYLDEQFLQPEELLAIPGTPGARARERELTHQGRDATALPASSLRFDGHVHSTFSDGTSDPGANLEAAIAAGLTEIVMAEHVRRSTDWLPRFVATADALREASPIRIRIGLETKMLDTSGALDLPSALDRVDLLLIADHQLPTATGPVHPVDARAALTSGQLAARTIVAHLLDSMAAAVGAAPLPAVLVHPFSILPKVGLQERDIPEERLRMLADRCRETSTAIEVNEKWRCPGPATLQVFQEAGVAVVAGSDAHASDAVGRYAYVRDVLGGLVREAARV